MAPPTIPVNNTGFNLPYTVQEEPITAAVNPPSPVPPQNQAPVQELDFFSTPKEIQLQRTSKQKQGELALKQAQRERTELLRREALSRDRTPIEVIKDSALSLGQGAIGIGSMAYGGVDLASQILPGPKTADSLFGLAENFGRASEILQEEKSAPLKFKNQVIQEKAQARKQNQVAEISKLQEDGYSQTQAEIINGGSEFLDTISDYADSPEVIFDEVIQSAFHLLGPGAVKGVLTNNLSKKVGSKVFERFARTKGGKEALEKLGEKAGVGYVAAAEGFTNGLQAKAEVLGTDFETLAETSPGFNEMVSNGTSPEDAREALSNDVMRTTALISAGVGAASSYVTGTGKFLANAGSPGRRVNEIFRKTGQTIEGAAKEGVEETLQGAGGTFAQNLAKQQSIDPNQDLTEGVAHGAGQGLVVGTAAGGAFGTVAPVVEIAKGTKDVAKKVVQKTTTKAKETLEKATETPFETSIRTVPLDTSATPQEQGAYVEKNVLPEFIKIQESSSEVINNPDSTDAQKADATDTLVKAQNVLVTEMQRIQTREDELSGTASFDEASDTLSKSKEYDDKAKESVDIILGSPPQKGITEKQADTLKIILDNESIPEEVKGPIRNYLETQAGIAAANKVGGINQEIIFGNPETRKPGLVQRQEAVDGYLLTGDTESAQREVDALDVFAKGHAEKAVNAREAYDKVQEDRTFETRIPGTGTTKSGLLISRGTPEYLIENIETEAKALTAGVRNSQDRIDRNTGKKEGEREESATTKGVVSPSGGTTDLGGAETNKQPKQESATELPDGDTATTPTETTSEQDEATLQRTGRSDAEPFLDRTETIAAIRAGERLINEANIPEQLKNTLATNLTPAAGSNPGNAMVVSYPKLRALHSDLITVYENQKAGIETDLESLKTVATAAPSKGSQRTDGKQKKIVIEGETKKKSEPAIVTDFNDTLEAIKGKELTGISKEAKAHIAAMQSGDFGNLDPKTIQGRNERIRGLVAKAEPKKAVVEKEEKVEEKKAEPDVKEKVVVEEKEPDPKTAARNKAVDAIESAMTSEFNEADLSPRGRTTLEAMSRDDFFGITQKQLLDLQTEIEKLNNPEKVETAKVETEAKDLNDTKLFAETINESIRDLFNKENFTSAINLSFNINKAVTKALKIEGDRTQDNVDQMLKGMGDFRNGTLDAKNTDPYYFIGAELSADLGYSYTYSLKNRLLSKLNTVLSYQNDNVSKPSFSTAAHEMYKAKTNKSNLLHTIQDFFL
ncbi:MAG: hypothetical protein DRH08_06615, partial [Deltaproteobacteria bacterium]